MVRNDKWRQMLDSHRYSSHQERNCEKCLSLLLRMENGNKRRHNYRLKTERWSKQVDLQALLLVSSKWKKRREWITLKGRRNKEDRREKQWIRNRFEIPFSHLSSHFPPPFSISYHSPPGHSLLYPQMNWTLFQEDPDSKQKMRIDIDMEMWSEK